MDKFSRSEWFGVVGGTLMGAAALGMATPARAATAAAADEEYKLPDLPYAPDALDPHIDAKTVTIHHDKHHAGYVNGLNSTLKKLKEAQKSGDFSSIQTLSRDLAFHGSGHVLHTLYWAGLTPKPKAPGGALAAAIAKDFGSVDALKAQLAAASKTAAGSGWGLLAYEPMGDRMVVVQIEKHENQILCGVVPLLVIDVWEHAYYLKYQNLRASYVDAIMNILNWDEAARRLDAARKALR